MEGVVTYRPWLDGASGVDDLAGRMRSKPCLPMSARVRSVGVAAAL